MKVVLVSLARRGGMVHFLAEVAAGLAPLTELAVMVAAQASPTYLPSGIAQVAIDTGSDRLGSAARLLSPLTWYRLAGKMRGLAPQVVHIVGVHEWNPLVAILCRVQGVPLVYTVHDPEAHPGTPWAIRLGDWLTSRLASILVALTSNGRQQLQTRGESSARVAIVPHPMYTLFRRWRPHPERSGKVILYFGRLEPYKGLRVLIQAFRDARRSLPGWKLIIAGDGQLPEGLGDGSEPDIEVVNHYVPDAQVAELMSHCSIVALPYTSATQSGVIALAQAFARPVVAMAVGGLNEMVVQGRTGILVPAGDQAAFTRALGRLARDPARRARMRREIRRIGDEKWGPQTVANAYLQVYRAVIAHSAAK